MLQTYNIVSGKEKVKRETLFRMASEGGGATRQETDPYNIKPQVSRLRVRKHFYLQKVVTDRKKISTELKTVKSVDSFQKGRGKYRRERVA